MKHTVSLILILCMLFALVACSAPSTPTETPQEQQHVHSFGDWAVTKNPTCTESGQQERLCSCGEKQTQAIPAKGHTFGEWTTVKASTCTEAGQKERVCSCGEKQTQAIATVGHSYGAWNVLKAATCTEAGEQERTCNVCGEKQVQTVSAKGHSFGAWAETQATCTKDGKKTHKCTVCGASEEVKITASGHQWKAATCTDPKKCTVCGATEGSALGHDYKNGVCTRCGEKFQPTVTIPTSSVKTKWYNYTLAEISSISYEFDSHGHLKVSFSVKKLSDSNGNNATTYTACRIRLLDSDGSVLAVSMWAKQGLMVGDSIKNQSVTFNSSNFDGVQKLKIEFIDYQ